MRVGGAFRWPLTACLLALGAVVLGVAAACTVERAQPTVVGPPEHAELQVCDKPMYNVVVLGPESEVEYE